MKWGGVYRITFWTGSGTSPDTKQLVFPRKFTIFYYLDSRISISHSPQRYDFGLFSIRLVFRGAFSDRKALEMVDLGLKYTI